jgi:excisionase family DNA binding protein
MTGRLRTVEEIAELLSVPVSWVRDHTRSGEIPHVPLGHYKRYREDDVLAWVETLIQPGKPGRRAYSGRNRSPRTADTAEGATTTKE